jgi:hypothetical protein
VLWDGRRRSGWVRNKQQQEEEEDKKKREKMAASPAATLTTEWLAKFRAGALARDALEALLHDAQELLVWAKLQSGAAHMLRAAPK